MKPVFRFPFCITVHKHVSKGTKEDMPCLDARNFAQVSTQLFTVFVSRVSIN